MLLMDDIEQVRTATNDAGSSYLIASEIYLLEPR
jgi:hypothetical protein